MGHNARWASALTTSRRLPMTRHVVGLVTDIPPGARKRVTVKGRAIAIFNVHGRFYGLFDRCPHQGGRLSDGLIIGLADAIEPGRPVCTRKGEILRCPWHGWEFDIRTGHSVTDPNSVRTRSYPVDVAPGQEVITQKLYAETVPVRVEEDYVVVEV
jgi:nitrite reductase/ring-hydroxylating ferredoxin subunit